MPFLDYEDSGPPGKEESYLGCLLFMLVLSD